MPTKEFLCCKCKDFFQGTLPAYVLVFDKCRGKTCPDCGKVRRLGKVKLLYDFNDRSRGGESLFGCAKCGKNSDAFLNGICKGCFYKVQKEKGCVCPFEEGMPFFHYYCSLCEEFHTGNNFTCQKCFEKENEAVQEKRNYFQAILFSVLGGMIIGFFLGWLLLVKLRKKAKKK